MKHIYIALFCFVILSSCEERPASGPGTIATKPVSVPVITPSTTPANAGPVPVSNVVTTTATSKLNPAHGQPEHKCDVAVGAPLPDGPVQNAKAATPASPAINPAVQTTPVLQTTPTTTPVIPTAAIAPGINPAHGQPGHRCDVAVGAVIPKTASTNVKTTTTPSPVVAPPVLQNFPIQPQAATATTTVANGLNPAHGQPGHRCDIEVGKPLNSAPKKN